MRYSTRQYRGQRGVWQHAHARAEEGEEAGDQAGEHSRSPEEGLGCDDQGDNAFLDGVKVKGGEITLAIKARGISPSSFRAGLSSRLRQAILNSRPPSKAAKDFVYISVHVSVLGLGPHHMHLLVQFLRTLQQPSSGLPVYVKELRAFKNNLGDEGARSVAELILSQKAPMLELHLSHNGIGNEGAAALVMSLGDLHPSATYPFRIPGKTKLFGACWLRMEWNKIEWPRDLVVALSGRVRVEATQWDSRSWGPCRSPDWAKQAEITPHCILHIFYTQESTQQGQRGGQAISQRDMERLNRLAESAYHVVEELAASMSQPSSEPGAYAVQVSHMDARHGSDTPQQDPELPQLLETAGEESATLFPSPGDPARDLGDEGGGGDDGTGTGSGGIGGNATSSAGTAGSRWERPRRWQPKKSLVGIDEEAASLLSNPAPAQTGPGQEPGSGAPAASADADSVGAAASPRSAGTGHEERAVVLIAEAVATPPLPMAEDISPPSRGQALSTDSEEFGAWAPADSLDTLDQPNTPEDVATAPRASNAARVASSQSDAPPASTPPGTGPMVFDQWLRNRAQAALITDQDKVEVEECLAVLLDAIREHIGPGWTVRAFGSVVTGFGAHGCDLDVVASVGGDENERLIDPASMLANLGSLLQASGSPIYVIKTILHARVPILKLQYECREVDLSVNNVQPLRNTRLLKAYASLDKRVVQLGILIKMWAKDHSLCGAPAGHLSSYALTLMVIFFLQVEQRIPNLQDDGAGDAAWETDEAAEAVVARVRATSWSMTHSLESLFCDFFSFYSKKFRWGFEVVSVRTALRAPATADHFVELKSRMKRQLHIEDPFERSRNLRDVMWAQNEQALKDAIFQGEARFRSVYEGGYSRGRNPRQRHTGGMLLHGRQGKGQRRVGQSTSLEVADLDRHLTEVWYASSQPSDGDSPSVHEWSWHQKGGWSKRPLPLGGPLRGDLDAASSAGLEGVEMLGSMDPPERLLTKLMDTTEGLDDPYRAQAAAAAIALGLMPSAGAQPASAGMFLAGSITPADPSEKADGGYPGGVVAVTAPLGAAGPPGDVEPRRKKGSNKIPKHFAVDNTSGASEADLFLEALRPPTVFQ